MQQSVSLDCVRSWFNRLRKLPAGYETTNRAYEALLQDGASIIISIKSFVI